MDSTLTGPSFRIASTVRWTNGNTGKEDGGIGIQILYLYISLFGLLMLPSLSSLTVFSKIVQFSSSSI